MESIARLVRDLSYWDSVNKLSLKEQETLEELKVRLVKEWAVVSDIRPVEARTKLDKLLAVGTS